MRTSSLMQTHAARNKIILGVNHEMRDFGTGRKKDLDLVIARPPAGGVPPIGGLSLKSLATRYQILLTSQEQADLAALPDVHVAPVGAVLVALEAKATMTAHVKSLPRLYDELNSSHLCVHGASQQALAIAYVQVNHADRFISPIINSKLIAHGLPTEITRHKQPGDTQRVLDKVGEIPRRTNKQGNGFDAIGISVLDLMNDGSPVTIVSGAPAPQQGDHFHYGSMIVRMANEYDATFAHI